MCYTLSVNETTAPITPATEPTRPNTYHDRMIDMVWELGERMTVGTRPEPRTVVTVLGIRHDRGRYVASLDREERGRGGSMRSIILGGPHYVQGITVLTEPCGRFSAKRFNEFADKALAHLRTMADTEAVVALFTYHQEA